MLNDEPEINLIEGSILTAAYVCESISDIVEYSKVHGVLDCAQFLDITLIAKRRIKKNARS